MNDQCMITDSHGHTHGNSPMFIGKCFSWSAVIVGALVAVGLSFLLNLFSIALSLSAFDVTPEGDTAFAVGGFLGLVIGAIVAMFVAGWVAGYLARPYCVKRNLGELYGFAAWCVSLIITIFLTAHVVEFVSNTSSVVRPATNITMTSNERALMVTQETRANSTATRATANTEKTTNALGMVAFVTFFLFFIGALSSSFGGRCGMSCRRKDMAEGSCK